MGKFSFNGVTIVAPGFILRSTINVQRVLQLLPFGTILMVGPADGGLGGGTVYTFDDMMTCLRILRGGALYNALAAAANVGGASGFVAVDAGTKTSASATITGASSSSMTLTAGDAGPWTNQIKYQVLAGTSSGVAFVVQYPDEYGNIITVGGTGTNYDNLADMNAIAATILADATLTPPGSTGYPAIVVPNVATNGVPTTGSLTALTGGTGPAADMAPTTVTASPTPTTTVFGLANAAGVVVGSSFYVGSNTTASTVTNVTAAGVVTVTPALGAAPAAGATVVPLIFADFKNGIDAIVDEPFDIGHLVGAYDQATQAYADGQADQSAPKGFLRRWIHQCNPTGTSATYTKQVNSAAIVNFGTARAEALNEYRAMMVAQHFSVLSPTTGLAVLMDAAPIICGYAAFVGATGANGPATPMTQDIIPTVLSVDYTVLNTTGDQDAAILGGLTVFEQLNSGVRMVQSVTTAPNDPTGAPWIYAEFSVVRVVDAVAANIKAAIETAKPKGLGAGNTAKNASYLLSLVRDILEDALQAQWITAFDTSAISFQPVPGSPTDAVITWDMTPVFPLNHLGLDQTIQPYSITVQTLPSTTAA